MLDLSLSPDDLLLPFLKKLLWILQIERIGWTFIYVKKENTFFVKINVFVEMPVGVIEFAFPPIFFELALTIEEMFGVRKFINEMVGVEKALFSHN